MEPGLALRSVESALRNIVRELMGATWANSLRNDQIDLLIAKREKDKQQRHGTTVNDDLLAYTETTQLTRIITRNWDTFRPVFKNKKRTDVVFEALNSYRLPAAHSRDMGTFEVDLLSGISGQIRNMITAFLNEQQQSRRYYPVIGDVTNGHGISGFTSWPNSVQQARLGDVETFDCTGWDTEGRELEWGINVEQTLPDLTGKYVTASSDFKFFAIGSSATLNIELTEDHVAERLFIQVIMRSEGRFHRHNYQYGYFAPGIDDVRTFVYTVTPW